MPQRCEGPLFPDSAPPLPSMPPTALGQFLFQGRTASAPLPPEARVPTPTLLEQTRSLDITGWNCQDKTLTAGLLHVHNNSASWQDAPLTAGLLSKHNTWHAAPTPANTMDGVLPEMAPLLQLAGSLNAALGSSGTALGGLLALSPSDGSEAGAGAPGAGVAEQQLSQWLSGVLPDELVDKACVARRTLSAPVDAMMQDKTQFGGG